MWSLGCVMAELVLGWPLYPGDSEFDQVRYICETQGLPNSHLLNMASKSSLYFKLSNTGKGGPTWILRQCASSEGSQAEGEHYQTAKHGKHVLGTLDQLCSIHTAEHEVFQKENAVAEGADRHCMVELIKRALTIDSHQRINPSAALRHPFITLSHLNGPNMRSYYDLSLQELQTALIPRTSSASHSDENCSQKAGYEEIFQPYQNQDIYKHMDDFSLVSDGNDLSSENEAGQHCPEGDYYRKLKVPYQLSCKSIQSYGNEAHDLISEVSDLEHQREHYEGQTVHLAEDHQQSPSLNQVENTTWKMDGFCITEEGVWGNTPDSWPGDLNAGSIHNHSGVTSELQTWSNPTETANHDLVNLSLTLGHTEEASHAASMFTSLTTLGNPHAIRQPNARPSRSDPTSGTCPISSIYMDAESSNVSSTGSFGISQEMMNPQVLFSPMEGYAEELYNPPQLFTVKGLPNDQDLHGQGEHRPPNCSYTNLKAICLLTPAICTAQQSGPQSQACCAFTPALHYLAATALTPTSTNDSGQHGKDRTVLI
ncbi:uncharacterized protein LOC143490239 isoform X5 [Brachyhypopomus gauderio]